MMKETHPELFSVLKFYHFKEASIILSMEIHFNYGIMTNVNTMPSSSFDLHISPVVVLKRIFLLCSDG